MCHVMRGGEVPVHSYLYAIFLLLKAISVSYSRTDHTQNAPVDCYIMYPYIIRNSSKPPYYSKSDLSNLSGMFCNWGMNEIGFPGVSCVEIQDLSKPGGLIYLVPHEILPPHPHTLKPSCSVTPFVLSSSFARPLVWLPFMTWPVLS